MDAARRIDQDFLCRGISMRMTDDQKDEFWVEPIAGLGNRMQVLASAYFLAKKYQKKLCILWNNDSDLAADFEDIFEALPNVRVIKVTTDGYHTKPFLRLKSERLRKKLLSTCSYVAEINTWSSRICLQEICSVVDEGVRGAEDVYVKSWKFFTPVYEDQEITLDFLRPSKKVLLRGRTLFERIGSDVVGVHIRRTDHEGAIADSPTEAFFREMERELERDGNCRFFVATDDQEVQREILSRFGEKVLLKENKSWGRTRTEGMLDACVDLWALSKCRKILGSKGSTFGQIAAKLGNSQLEIVTKDMQE